MKTRKVEPIGTRQVNGFACSPGEPVQTTWTEAVYPPSLQGDAIHLVRRERGISLREGAKALGLEPVELSDIEHGRRIFEYESDWRAAFALLASVKREPGGGPPTEKGPAR